MNSKLIQKIQQRQEEGTMRSLLLYEGFTDFFSNDYLGMAHFERSYVLKGATGSRLISGNSTEMERVEQRLADFFEAESALFFQSGYAANLGFFGSVPQKGDVVLYDEECHASIRDGLRLSTASSYKFLHNNLQDLHKKLEKFRNADHIYVVVEGLYSMSGRKVEVDSILELCDEFQAELIVDEAHSAGVFGEEGKGLFYKHSVTRLITFGKAYGGHGAIWLCSSEMRSYLVNFSRSFIYTTATPLAQMEHSLEQVLHVSEGHQRALLQQNVVIFRSGLGKQITESDAQSPIQMLHFSSREELKEMEKSLLEERIAVKAIYAPTVRTEKEGLRVSLHSFNTQNEIIQCLRILGGLS